MYPDGAQSDYKMVVVNLKFIYSHLFLLILLQHSDLATGRSLEDPDPCQSTSCGEVGVCEASPGQVLCKCPPGYSGEGLDGCRPESACQAYDRPCGEKAICKDVDNEVSCECPPGLVGNPLLECTGQTHEDKEELRELLIEAKCPENKDLKQGKESEHQLKMK